jgi:hypothetical protein
MTRLLLILLAFGPVLCQAEPYWVRYEPASGLFPDEDGWTREVSDPAPERWIADDLLFIDSRASYGMTDIYRMYSDGTQDPGAGETFVARWRLKVDEIGVWGDPGMIVVSDDQYCMWVECGYDELWTYPFVDFVPFEPGLFHTYELQSTEMRQFQLYVDGALALQGPLVGSISAPKVSWGDMSTDSSLAEWEYFEFGVVPEPSALLCTLAAATMACASRATRRPVSRRRRMS